MRPRGRAAAFWAACDERQRMLLIGVGLVLFTNLLLFSTYFGVVWDARDQMLLYWRWFGACLRSGQFGDFFPNIDSGYPVASNLQAGAYNLFHLLFAVLLCDTALAANLFYLVLQFAIFFLSFALGRSYSLPPVASLYLALSFVASGFVVGHASHFSYLSSAVGLMAILLAMRSQKRGQAFLLSLVGTYHMLTAGYPAIIIFGAQVLALIFAWQLWKGPRQTLLPTALGALVGVALSAPALLHFGYQISRSSRGQGVSVATVLSGALPGYALPNFALPYRWLGFTEPTMERFHLLGTSLPLIIFALYVAARRQTERRSIVVLWLALGVLFSLWAFGWGGRAFLAQHLFFYRVGRYPSGEHRGLALFCLAMVSSYGMAAMWERFPTRRRIMLILVGVDFVAVMYSLLFMRIWPLADELRGVLPIYQVLYGPADQHKIDTPRLCPTDNRWWIEQFTTPPDRFSWYGYTNMQSREYTEHKKEMRWALCGPSRLWRMNDRTAKPYRLQLYSPSRIEFTTSATEPERLLFADTTDGRWQLSINGTPARFVDGPAALRYFDIAPGESHVQMIYKGPLSGLWR